MICCNSNVSSDNGIPIYISRPWLPVRRYSLASDYFSVLRLLKKHAPDVVYTRTGTPLVGIGARYCQAHNKTLVYHIAHKSDVEPPIEKGRRAFLKRLQRPLYEYGLRRANVILAQAHYQSELLRRNYHINATAIIPNFHPTPPKMEKRTDIRTVLWVANLKPSKRPEVFVELARRLRHIEHTQFLMIGAIQDPAYRSLSERTSDLCNFSYLGAQPVEEVNRLMSSADIFVNTSQSEGFPNTFIQAWLNALPVVSFDLDPDYLLRTKKLGEDCQGDIDLLTSTVSMLLLDNAKRFTIGTKARIFAIENYGEVNCEKLIALMHANYKSRG